MKVKFKTKDGRIVVFNKKTPKKLRALKGFSGSKLKKSSESKLKNVEVSRFTSKKSKSRSRAIPRQRGNTMAKRRRSRRSGGIGSGGLTNVLLGGAVAGFIGSMIPYGNYGKLGAALVGHKQGGIVGNTAKALGVIGVANLVSGAGISTAIATTAGSAAKW